MSPFRMALTAMRALNSVRPCGSLVGELLRAGNSICVGEVERAVTIENMGGMSRLTDPRSQTRPATEPRATGDRGTLWAASPGEDSRTRLRRLRRISCAFCGQRRLSVGIDGPD